MPEKVDWAGLGAAPPSDRLKLLLMMGNTMRLLTRAVMMVALALLVIALTLLLLVLHWVGAL